MYTRIKNLDSPDDVATFEKMVQHTVELGELTIGRAVTAPGWRWSTHMRPHVGGEWCQARHVGVVLSGRLGVAFADGTKIEIGPNEVYDIPPGHDGYTIGDEPCVQLEWAGLRTFLAERGVGRALAAILITDLVDSTSAAIRLGDARWREVLASHFEHARAALDRHRGREVKTAGDSLLATFDGPAPALACACAIRRAAASEGLEVRACVHVGEIERAGSDIHGVAVHEAARIVAHAQAGEVLVSELTRTLASASGHAFTDRGAFDLKGLPGPWRLYALAPS